MTAPQIAALVTVLAAPIAVIAVDVLAVRWLERWERRFTDDTNEETVDV